MALMQPINIYTDSSYKRKAAGVRGGERAGAVK